MEKFKNQISKWSNHQLNEWLKVAQLEKSKHERFDDVDGAIEWADKIVCVENELKIRNTINIERVKIINNDLREAGMEWEEIEAWWQEIFDKHKANENLI